MKKHLAHLAAALAVTLLFGAAAGPLSAAAAAPTAILDEENTAAAESRLNQSWLDMEIEYDDLNPVYQLYLSSAAPDDWVYQWYSTNPAVATVDRNGLVTAQKPGKTTIVANTYTTKADFNNLTIGGTNLLLNTSGVFVGHPSASGVNANAGWLPRLVDGLTYSTLSAGTYQLRFEVMTDTEVGSYIVQWAGTPWGISSFSLSKGVWKTLTYTIVKPDGATGKA